MEIICSRKIIWIIFIAFCGCKQNKPNSITGVWYGYYGDSREYGEAIYEAGHACFYSEDGGLIYRDYKEINDSTIGIFNNGTLDHERIVEFKSPNSMVQTVVLNPTFSTAKLQPVFFTRILDSKIDPDKIFKRDTLEQNKFVQEFRYREVLLERKE